MGKTGEVKPVKLIMGIIASGEDVMREAEELMQDMGRIDLRSPVIPFDFTDYYEKEMGTNLLRQWWSFTNLINPEEIADIKLKTNEIEAGLSIESPQGSGNYRRRINLDPGYIDGAKLVLVSTKDYSHRIYLQKGIYAELTLIYEKGAFHPLPWTYPDYRTEVSLSFFQEARSSLIKVRLK